jgi:hypothetical protein
LVEPANAAAIQLKNAFAIINLDPYIEDNLLANIILLNNAIEQEIATAHKYP